MTRVALFGLGLYAVLGVYAAAVFAQESSQPVVRIATDATFAPFHWIDEEGQVTGFDVELARKIAEEMDASADIRVLEYATLFTGLEDSSHDIVAATTGITAERQTKYQLSRPYFTTCQVAVVRNDAGEPQTLTDLAGARIGAAGSGTSARAMKKINGEHVVLADGGGPASLADHSIDAWIVDEFDGVQVARQSESRYRVLPEPVAQEQYALVMAKGRESLKRQVDEALAALEQSGWISELGLRFGLNGDPDWPVRCR